MNDETRAMSPAERLKNAVRNYAIAYADYRAEGGFAGRERNFARLDALDAAIDALAASPDSAPAQEVVPVYQICDQFLEGTRWFDASESAWAVSPAKYRRILYATPPAQEAALPPIERDESMNREYIPLPGGWEVQTKGNGSTLRLVDTKTGERFALPLLEFVIEFVERMAREVHAAVRAQHPQPAQEAEAALLEEIDNRDRNAEWANKLADAIAEYLGVDIGEHSSANDPWQNALDAIEGATLPAQEAAVTQQPVEPEEDPSLHGCLCRWDADDKPVQTCDLHRAQQPATSAVPAGWKLVPVKVTTAQRLAMAKADDETGDRYRLMAAAMLAATPIAPEPAQPQAAGVEALPCGHPASLMLKSAETGADLYCQCCDAQSRARDAEKREGELQEELRAALATKKAAPEPEQPAAPVPVDKAEVE